MENINDTNNFGFNFDNDQTELDNSQETQTETRKTKPSNNNANVSPQIPTDSAPFIVLCGPPSSGKSMVLKSLASYLCKNEKIGYIMLHHINITMPFIFLKDNLFFL